MDRIIRKSMILLLLGATLPGYLNALLAFDGQRKGFIVGIGFGPGFTTFTREASFNGSSAKSDRETRLGIQTDFKIGYAPGNTLEICYTNKVSWFRLENDFGDNVTIASGLTSVAISHFFKPEGPSPFISGGIGIASWSTGIGGGDNPLDEFYSLNKPGLGFFAGGGYEFSRHWDIEGNIILGRPGDKGPGFDEVNRNVLTFQITINVKAY